MSFNIALVIDPSWSIMYPQVLWNDPYFRQSPRAVWFSSIRSQVSLISQQPADLILTPAMDSSPLDALFGETQTPLHHHWILPHILIPTTQHHPTKHLYERLKTFKILSRQFWTNPTKKNPTAQPIPGAVPISTQYGLLNANAHNDAIERMLTQSKYKIDHMVIVDPYNRIRTGGMRITAASNPGGVHYETWLANYKAQQMGLSVTVVV
jgi:hypothetical protein